VVGTLTNARLTSDATGEGQTDLKIDQIIKGSEFLKGVNVVTLARYYPGDGKGPQRGVFFFEVREGKLHLIGGRSARSEHLTGYLRAVAALNPDGALPFYMRYLDHPDPDLAADAFVELARSAD